MPKGPSLDPAERRLAMEVEDHPLSWGSFEGVIPEGTYGAGAVIVWDRGTYTNLSERDGEPIAMAEALDAGHAAFRLAGEKLLGAWSLRRMSGAQRRSWLLVKRRDEHADAQTDLVAERPESVLSGRTIDDFGARR